jgi:galactokinase
LQGDAGVGTHGGSEDHAAIVEGRTRMVSAFAFVPARALGAERIPGDWRFVIAPSGVAARKTGEALEPYNRLSRGVSILLEAWNADGPRRLSLAAALKTGPGAAQRLRELADRAATPETPAPWLRDRLEHFLREDERPLQAMAAFAASDERTLGDLSSASQREAEGLLGNQVPATAALAASARTHGAFAASSFGAGFGGAVWALAHVDDAERFAQKWHQDAFVIHAGLPLTDLS